MVKLVLGLGAVALTLPFAALAENRTFGDKRLAVTVSGETGFPWRMPSTVGPS